MQRCTRRAIAAFSALSLAGFLASCKGSPSPLNQVAAFSASLSQVAPLSQVAAMSSGPGTSGASAATGTSTAPYRLAALMTEATSSTFVDAEGDQGTRQATLSFDPVAHFETEDELDSLTDPQGNVLEQSSATSSFTATSLVPLTLQGSATESVAVSTLRPTGTYLHQITMEAPGAGGLQIADDVTFVPSDGGAGRTLQYTTSLSPVASNTGVGQFTASGLLPNGLSFTMTKQGTVSFCPQNADLLGKSTVTLPDGSSVKASVALELANLDVGKFGDAFLPPGLGPVLKPPPGSCATGAFQLEPGASLSVSIVGSNGVAGYVLDITQVTPDTANHQYLTVGVLDDSNGRKIGDFAGTWGLPPNSWFPPVSWKGTLTGTDGSEQPIDLDFVLAIFRNH